MPDLNKTLLAISAASYCGSVLLLFYEHVGYPLLLVLLSFTRKAAKASSTISQPTTDFPKLSMLVAAHNEQIVLPDKLANILALDYPTECLEILIGSDGSQDETNLIVTEFIAAHPQLCVKLLPFANRRGKAAVLNDLVSAASHELLCLSDANVMFHPDVLRRLTNAVAQEGVGAATGRVILASDDSNFAAGERAYYSIEVRLQEAESRLGSLMGVDGGMYVLRKSLFRELPMDTILDDFVISMRVIRSGYRVVYVPEAIADENGTPTGSQEFRRRVRVAAGAAQVLKRGEYPHPWQVTYFWQFASHKLSRWFGPLWLIVLFASNIALIGLLPHKTLLWYSLIGSLVGQVVVYAAALAATYSLTLRKSRLGAVSYYFMMSHVAIAIGLIKGLFNRQSVTWQPTERAKVVSTPNSNELPIS